MRDGWVYFKMFRGVYGIPQSEILDNNPFNKNLINHGYYQFATTPGHWRHKWRSILFCLIVDNFGVKYVGERHAHHLRNVLKEHDDITKNWKGYLYTDINLTWDYDKPTCRLTMDNYI